jgi:hypothetical protein
MTPTRRRASTSKLNDHWLVQVGLSAGNDVAREVGAPNAKPTFNACVGYTWTEGRDNLYVCDNSTNSGKYAYNNLQAYYATWYPRFGTSSWHMATESWYMWKKRRTQRQQSGSRVASHHGCEWRKLQFGGRLNLLCARISDHELC